jgi:hypothetical protein
MISSAVSSTTFSAVASVFSPAGSRTTGSGTSGLRGGAVFSLSVAEPDGPDFPQPLDTTKIKQIPNDMRDCPAEGMGVLLICIIKISSA